MRRFLLAPVLLWSACNCYLTRCANNTMQSYPGSLCARVVCARHRRGLGDAHSIYRVYFRQETAELIDLMQQALSDLQRKLRKVWRMETTS